MLLILSLCHYNIYFYLASRQNQITQDYLLKLLEKVSTA